MANSVVEAILNATSDKHTREAMLTGSYLESSWRADAVGDQGHSYGAFQIYLPAHPGVTAAQAKDPAWAAKFMLRGYQAGARAQPESLWRSNPAQAAENAAIAAERPARPYSATQGAARVRQAYQAATDALSGKVSTDGGGGASQGAGGESSGGATTAVPAGLNPIDAFTEWWGTTGIGKFFDAVEMMAHWWWTHKMRLALIGTGSLMVVVGGVLFAMESI